MPLGYERLNERSSRPNTHINFIVPLPNAPAADQQYAKSFLERIAAQCYPVMKKHSIYVQTLEEFPPNTEFLGRNFNAGECIQLILKDRAGRWLGFKFVQMVMMHELAHCKQMNHSKAFWAQRNLYASQMEDLWKKKYMGEGIWGKGKNLTSGIVVSNDMPVNPEVPEHLCGGTYRRNRGLKRKRGGQGDDKKETYAERQQKRITRKFGKHGQGNALGEDELVRGALEQKNRGTGKPKVAASKRGRELRANAALVRFEAAKEQQNNEKTRQDTPAVGDDSETESDWSGSEADVLGGGFEKADKSAVRDSKGRELIQICGDEGDDEEGGQDELDTLRHLRGGSRMQNSSASNDAIDSETESENEIPGGKNVACAERAQTQCERNREQQSSKVQAAQDTTIHTSPATLDASSNSPSTDQHTIIPLQSCPICSLENDPAAATCMVCANVLQPRLLVTGYWRCKSKECQGSKYINPGDAGRCGVCRGKRPAATLSDASASTSFGLLQNDVLRWD